MAVITNGVQLLDQFGNPLSTNNGIPISGLNPNGQNTSANSSPVVPASDWFGPVQIGDGTTPSQKMGVDTSGRAYHGVFTSALFTTAQVTQPSGNSGDIDVSKLHEISIDITITLITTNVQFFWERKGADGVYYPLWQTNVLTSLSSSPVSTSVGPGLAFNQSLGLTGRFRWVATGNTSFTPNIYGK